MSRLGQHCLGDLFLVFYSLFGVYSHTQLRLNTTQVCRGLRLAATGSSGSRCLTIADSTAHQTTGKQVHREIKHADAGDQ